MSNPFHAIILDALDGLVPPGAPIALLDFPNHGNVGDNAIWAGERAWMRAVGLTRIVYASEADRYEEDTLRRRLGPSGVIVMHGGGNFGDIYTGLQAFRERIARRFPSHRIVQLPQSLHFGDPAAAARAARVFRHHDDYHLVVRDRRSLLVAHDLGLPARLCPDMALALTLAPRQWPAANAEVLCLLRDDAEVRTAELRAALARAFRCVDWTGEPLTPLARADRFVAHRLPWVPARLTLDLYDRLADQRLARGSRLLAGAQVVVTDRLHAHVLCCLLGIPHCVLDNSYGKVRAVFETWTARFACARWCDGPGEVMAAIAAFGEVTPALGSSLAQAG